MLLPYEAFKIIPHKRVIKYLQKLSLNERKKLIQKIDDLVTDDYKLLKIKKLKGFKDSYRVTIDDTRIIFIPKPKEKVIYITVIGHRKEIYDILKNMPINFLTTF
jgi:mRNA interferase RelE/StbE